MTSITTPVTFEEIRSWLMNRDPWPREILHAIARAAGRTANNRISSNHLLHDPEFQIADNQVNTIPTAFATCGKHGWIRKVGIEPTESLRGHGRDVKVYEITPAGHTAFRFFVELGAGNRTAIKQPESSPVASPELCEERNDLGGEPRQHPPREVEATRPDDTDGSLLSPSVVEEPGQRHGAGKPSAGFPADPVPLFELEEPDPVPSHIDVDQRKAA